MFFIALVAALGIVSLLYLFKFGRGMDDDAGSQNWLQRWIIQLWQLLFIGRFTMKTRRKPTEAEYCASGPGNFSYRDFMYRDPEQGALFYLLENGQSPGHTEHMFHRIAFTGTDKDGKYISCSVTSHKDHGSHMCLTLTLPGVGSYRHPHYALPNVWYTANTECGRFSAGGLTCEMIEPMTSWRVSFSGKLRKCKSDGTTDTVETFVETCFSFTWKSFSQPFDYGNNITSESGERSGLSNMPRYEYQQWGEMRGRLTVEGQDETVLYLQAYRTRYCGEKLWQTSHKLVSHQIYLENGMCIQAGVISESHLHHDRIGYLSHPNGDLSEITKLDLIMCDLDQQPVSKWSFVAGGHSYSVTATASPSSFVHELGSGVRLIESVIHYTVNDVTGHGVVQIFCRDVKNVTTEETTLCRKHVPEASDELVKLHSRDVVLNFIDLASTSATLVGGKGAQLAQLTQIEKHVGATVPSGFCLTLWSFELQLKNHPQIERAISELERSAIESLSSLGDACEETMQEILVANICDDVKDAIWNSLRDVSVSTSREGDENDSHFAVRSSAAGEDGTEASSAGQMETILGVVGFDKILDAVRECWASVYAHQAVEYRRQHGQPIRVSVGVVIQHMVPAQAAGVMFTADPVSGSSSKIVINANFGLGESVVSGSSDPDTIHIHRDPTSPLDSTKLQVGDVRIGEKKTIIVGRGDGGIKEEISADKDSTICLTEVMILRLATLGLELEKWFGSPRDIEWAVVGEDIFMLQCRPITVSETETEWNLLHEFDSPMTCDYEWMTTSNISEMIPGALTPLSLSTFSSAIEYSLQMLLHHVGARQRPLHLSKCLPSICNHLFIALIDVGSIVCHAMMARKDMMELSLLGSPLPEMTTGEMEMYAGKSTGLRRFVNFVNMMRMWSKASSICSWWEKNIPSYTVGDETVTSEQLYSCINNQLEDYETVWVWTLINSGRSGNMATVVMSILGGDAKGWTTEHYGDMALLLSQCNGVYSAEVPHAIENIAREIAKKGEEDVDRFITTPDKESMELLSKYPDISAKVECFLTRHGHRCLRESEMREKSWRSAPEKFISVVKLMLKTKAYEKSEKSSLSTDDLLNRLNTKLPFHKRMILKYLLPKAWQAVGAREWGKSLSVQMHDKFKQAYGRLGHLLHCEGRLPDPDLVYFLSHFEIGKLIDTRSARLVIKAQKRRKILTKQMSLKFDQMNKSRPVPVDIGAKTMSSVHVECLQGMPVSQGQITGPARVVHSLEGATAIQAGDILIVKSTDVGWSPYFPLIGGLVTELGGLISHGAVVAREYGIPCVVNVSKATSVIVSGETLELDGRAGTVKRLEKGCGESCD